MIAKSTDGLQAPNRGPNGASMSYGSILARKCPIVDETLTRTLDGELLSLSAKKCPLPYLGPQFDEGECIVEATSLGEFRVQTSNDAHPDLIRNGPPLPLINGVPSLPHFTEVENAVYEETVDKIKNCATEMKAYIHCNCAAIAILNNCGSNVCASCWASKCSKQRKEWGKKLQFDRGRSYRFLTLTSPRRYFTWELDDAITSLHSSFRKLTKSSWWRGLSRLWFGTIEFEPAWSQYIVDGEEIIVPTVNLHIHVVVGGSMIPINKLREKWVGHGGGRQCHIVYMKPADTRHASLKGIISYISKYMTDDKKLKYDNDGNLIRKLSWSKLPVYYRAVASHQLKSRQIFISGGQMRTRLAKLLRENPDIEEPLCCIACGSMVGLSYMTDDTICPHPSLTMIPAENQWIPPDEYIAKFLQPPSKHLYFESVKNDHNASLNHGQMDLRVDPKHYSQIMALPHNA